MKATRLGVTTWPSALRLLTGQWHGMKMENWFNKGHDGEGQERPCMYSDMYSG